jgi:hypothetical protein
MFNCFLKYKLKRYARHSPREKRFLNLKEIRTVLVLFDTAEFAEASRCIDRLKSLGKQVTVCAYQQKQDMEDYSYTNFYILPQKTIERWFHNPLPVFAAELRQVSFDVLINLSVRPNLPLAYLTACALASIKIGGKSNDFIRYDLSIMARPETDTDPLRVEELAQQILHYLDNIRSPFAATPVDSPLPPVDAAVSPSNTSIPEKPRSKRKAVANLSNMDWSEAKPATTPPLPEDADLPPSKTSAPEKPKRARKPRTNAG